MIKFAVNFSHPIALRYPRGEAFDQLEEFRAPVEWGKSELLYEHGEVVLLAYGSMVKTALQVRESLRLKGQECAIVNLRFAKPLDTRMLREAGEKYKLMVTMEENVLSGGIGEAVSEYLDRAGISVPVLHIAVEDEFIPHGNVELLKKQVGLDADSIVEKIRKQMEQR